MKRLIVCCDGTWNRADQENHGEPCPTNVVKLAFRVAKRDPRDVPQIVHYGQGVGTGNALDRFSGGALGHGLEDNVLEAYRFLVGNYEDGDELFVFGFSRGAYTARSLVGMIRKCGILKRTSVREYRRAVALYRSAIERPETEAARGFRAAHSICAEDVPVKFVGVWDTVGSLGIPLRGLRWLSRRKHQFHDTELSRLVERAYHALAIDEHRAPFAPTLWADRAKSGQFVEQVWFAGAHSDIGGGYGSSMLSDMSLAWMMEKAEAAGLSFDLDAPSIFPAPAGDEPMPHNSKTGWYRVTPGIDRTIGIDRSTGAADSTQLLHPSVLTHWDAHQPRRSRTLLTSLERLREARSTPS